MNPHMHSEIKRTRGWRSMVPLLLIIPYIGTLWVSSYTSIQPEVWGIPFFYWYQFIWIGIGAAITIVVYLSERPAQDSTRE
jgi:hypothetical protein